MKRKSSHKTRRLAVTALTLLAAMLLVACGSSSTSTTSTATHAGATSTSKAGGAPGAGAGGRFTALRECLKKEGITLPQRVPGKAGAPPSGGAVPFAGGGGGGGLKAPAGVSAEKFEAALKKCGGGKRPGGAGAVGRLKSPTFVKSLESFAACMRQNGVAVPKPNTSGNGPIFSTKGLNTKSAAFAAAQKKCASLLKLARPGGAQGAPPGAPSAG